MLTDLVSLIIRWELLKEGLSTWASSVESDASQKLSLFDECFERSGEDEGGEIEDCESDRKALHGM